MSNTFVAFWFHFDTSDCIVNNDIDDAILIAICFFILRASLKTIPVWSWLVGRKRHDTMMHESMDDVILYDVRLRHQKDPENTPYQIK